MQFNLISPQSIYFGCDKIKMLPQLVHSYSGDILVVISRSASQNPKVVSILDTLHQDHTIVLYDGVTGEPTVDIVNDCTQLARDHHVSLVVSIGGGSVIDTAKATAGFAPNTGELIDYIEGVGVGKPLLNTPIDHIAIPTTSGTGSEMTKNAVIMGNEVKFKRSFRHDMMVPIAAIIDPSLTTTVPEMTTAYSGMDAIVQLIESYISRKSTPITDALAIEALTRVGSSLVDAYLDGTDITARTNMAYASMISGICLANSGLGAVHGIAAGLGAVLGTPHGMACAILLPHIMRLNAPHMGEKTSTLCSVLTGSCTGESHTDIAAIVNHINTMIEALGIPRNFGELGITESDARDIIHYSSSSSMSGNPYEITDEEIFSILTQA